MKKEFLWPYITVSLAILYSSLCVSYKVYSQENNIQPLGISGKNTSPFFIGPGFIKNIGQYGDFVKGHVSLGKICFGYEGLGQPVLFTQRGIIHIQKEKAYYNKKQAELETNAAVRLITMEWVGANQDPEIISQKAVPEYYTFGLLKERTTCYKKLLFKEIYPGIDLLYSFTDTETAGYKYSFIVSPGADIRLIKLKFGGDIKSISTNSKEELVIKTDIYDITQTAPLCFYSDSKKETFTISFQIINSEISFKIPSNYNGKKTLVIDPFVSTTAILSGATAGIAKDIDYDFAGNIYVVGGGDRDAQKLAKFDRKGILQWVFSGLLINPQWNFGYARGGWTVDKSSGDIYLGQGEAGSGFRIIRLNSSGIFDGYITAANSSFRENWKMFWICNNDLPKILIGGGGVTPNEFGVILLPGTIPSALNITGYVNGNNDISDFIFDASTNDMYTIFSVPFNTPGTQNKIYKHLPPYTNTTLSWSSNSGHSTLQESDNRPYIGGVDNSSNTLAINNNYLFYWDGKNLKAFNKFSGIPVGLPIIVTGNTELLQGGIYADDCNNVYVGSTSGVIKIFKFNGVSFDDNAATDIKINGVTGSVYDIVYDSKAKLIYACGNNFVASMIPTEFCAANQVDTLSLSVIPNNLTLSARASVTSNNSNAPIAFLLCDSLSNITSNTSGVFTGLNSNRTYTIKAVIKSSCDSILVKKDFILSELPDTLKNNIHVPNAFTPNGDGLNDILKIIAPGIKKLNYFNIYNRYGQLLFTTKERSIGWDGKFKGKLQSSGTYVWTAEAIDNKGNNLHRNGTVVIIQ